jgi:chemotaxis protein CheD
MVVRITEMAVTSEGGEVLCAENVTTALAVCLYDPVRKLAGLAHPLLPTPTVSVATGGILSGKYVETAVPELVAQMLSAGGTRVAMKAVISGAADDLMYSKLDPSMAIGVRNTEVACEALARDGVSVASVDVGGAKPRNVSLEAATGRVSVLTMDETYEVAILGAS